DTGAQYLEDISTAYWFSEVLFAAVEMEVFSSLERGGKTIEELSEEFKSDTGGMERFLHALETLGLVYRHGPRYYNTRLSSDYLVTGNDNYQGNSILWRKYLSEQWKALPQCIRAGGRVDFGPGDKDTVMRIERMRRYIDAMDSVAKAKMHEIASLFEGVSLEGGILDVGAGSGAISAGFLERFPLLRAVLMDLPEVIDYCSTMIEKRGLKKRVSCCGTNILEAWPVSKKSFSLVILSNIVHAFSEKEAAGLLQKASECLTDNGYLIVHDLFLEHFPQKAALFDLNMFINTYNGRVFSRKWIEEELSRLGLHKTGFIPLKTDTAIIVASKNKEGIGRIITDPKQQLISKFLDIGFSQVLPVTVKDIHVSEWTDLRCRFGCDSYGKPHCPPNSPSSQKTREALKDYTHALLLEGEPPTQSFQLKVLKAEGEAFKSGFHKAFAYWAGPCSICDNCTVDIEGICTNTANARPSMEGSGIDVFETVRKSGTSLRTLRDKNDFVKYFGLLLLE
ncbi:MAG: DUF2284 domain-containing protein, partial [Nitrospirota bacterium]